MYVLIIIGKERWMGRVSGHTYENCSPTTQINKYTIIFNEINAVIYMRLLVSLSGVEELSLIWSAWSLIIINDCSICPLCEL